MTRKRISRPIALGIAFLAAVLVVAACGAAEPTPTPQTPPEAQVIVHTPTPAPTPTQEVIVQTATPGPTPAPGPTPTQAVIVQTATPGPTPTPGPTSAAEVIVQTATPTAVPNVGAITEEIVGWRVLQGNGLDTWRTPPQRGGTYIYSFPLPTRGTDLVVSDSFATAVAVTPSYNSITRCTPAPYLRVGDIGACVSQGDLATEWSTTDALTWTFKLAEGVTWHNIDPAHPAYSEELKDLYGRELTADDVVHTAMYWRGLLTKPDGEPQGTPQNNLRFTIQLADARAIDRYTVELTLNRPDPHYPTLLSEWNARIFPPEVFALDGGYNARVVGTGPMIQVSHDPQVEVSFAANPDYFKPGADGAPLPYLDAFEVLLGVTPNLSRSAMITGKIDMDQQNLGVNTPSAAVNYGRLCPDCTIVESFQTWRLFSVGFKTEGEDAPFADPKARLAVAKAIDHEAMIDNVLEGAGAILPVTGAWNTFFDEFPDLRAMGNNLPDAENPYVFDPETARGLWAEADPNPGEGHEIIYWPYVPLVTVAAEVIAAQLTANLGVRVEAKKATDIGTYYSAIGLLGPPRQRFPSMAIYIQLPTVAPAAWAASFVFGPPNLEDRKNPVLERLALQWLQETDPAKVREIARQWYAEIINDFRSVATAMPAVYHIQSKRTRNMYEFRLAGLQLHQGGWHIEYVWVDHG